MKKVYILTVVFITYLSNATTTLAATSINPCPRAGGGNFGVLCNYNINKVTIVIQNIITILFIVATLASLFFLVAGGIKWITSGGDKANLEQARSWILAAVIGLIITFSSYFIINLILYLFGLNSISSFNIPNLFTVL